MRRTIVGFLLMVLLATTALSHTVEAAEARAMIAGVVTYHGRPVSGAKVFAACDNGGAYANRLTDDQGRYSVILAAPIQCPMGSRVGVWVVAEDLHRSGWTFGVIQGATTTVNVAIENIAIQIPEYGLFAGVVAVGVGAVIIALTRRRYLY